MNRALKNLERKFPEKSQLTLKSFIIIDKVQEVNITSTLFDRALMRTESNLHQPNILSGRVTRSNSTDEFSLT